MEWNIGKDEIEKMLRLGLLTFHRQLSSDRNSKIALGLRLLPATVIMISIDIVRQHRVVTGNKDYIGKIFSITYR